MSTVCTHPRDYHRDGETCRTAGSLKPGDQIRALAGAMLVVVRDAAPAQYAGYTSLVLPGSGDAPCPLLIGSDTVLTVRPRAGLKAEELPEPEPEVEIRAAIQVAEESTYSTDVTLTVPVSAAADDEALEAYLGEHWQGLSDFVDGATATIDAQYLISASVVERGRTA